MKDSDNDDDDNSDEEKRDSSVDEQSRFDTRYHLTFACAARGEQAKSHHAADYSISRFWPKQYPDNSKNGCRRDGGFKYYSHSCTGRNKKYQWHKSGISNRIMRHSLFWTFSTQKLNLTTSCC
jgi:hypothetical protein